MKFKDFQAPVLFSSTFKALHLGEKNSSTFKNFQGCVGTLIYTFVRPISFHITVDELRQIKSAVWLPGNGWTTRHLF